ncbi:MAG: class I SAM-dependent methyltransferase [Deltaproteobacteria bacterium]|nr:class I SAM-dependent methyltransferase [Deltaproteobacteria bacterium]
MLARVPCALCGESDYRLLHDMGWRRVLRCARCGLIRADPLPSIEEKVAVETLGYTDETAYPEVRDFFKNCHRDFVDDPVIRGMRQTLADLEQALERPGTLLDVGAGTGIFMHLARERGWTTTGVDICPLTADKAAREFDVRITVGSFEQHDFDSQRFDAVTMLDVLEHVYDPLAALRRVHALLRPGGAVFIAVPNQRSLLTAVVDAYARAGGPWADKLLLRLYVAPHLHYFTPVTIRRLVDTAGFRLHTLQQGKVYLGRYRLSPVLRIPLEMILAAGAAVGMNARLGVLAVKQ